MSTLTDLHMHWANVLRVLVAASWMGLLTGCEAPTSEPLVPLVSDSIMVEVIIEFHLLEARAELLQEDVLRRRDSVLLMYGVTSEDYEATMMYYSDNSEAYMQIYTDALDKLSDERYMEQ